jgi:hypothetical protein
MSERRHSRCIVFLILILLPTCIYGKRSTTNHLINIIEGTVYDPYQKPVPEIYVELQNDLYSTISRVRTPSSGRFTFTGLSSGHYNIKVLTSGTNYLEQTQGVDLVNVVRGASDTAYLDIYLTFDSRKTRIGDSQITEAVFVQEIPELARSLYKSGLRKLNSKEFEAAIADLDKAIQIFPEYFDALNAAGCSLVGKKEYSRSVPYLIKAIDINQRSFSSFYSLGFAALQMNRIPEAAKAAKAALVLQNNSLNAHLLYGTVLRIQGDYEAALATLLKAKKLDKGSNIPEIYWQIALVYDKLNRFGDAADELEIYLKAAPDRKDKKEVEDLIQKLRSKSAKGPNS